MLAQSYFPKLENACEGDYKVRILKKKVIQFSKIGIEDFSEMNPIKILQFSASRKMKISLGFEIKTKKEFEFLNDDLKVFYSIDHGLNWKKAGDIHPLKSNFAGLDIPSLIYSTILPSAINEQSHVLVMLAASNPGKAKKLRNGIKKNSYEIFQIYRKYVPFKIESLTNVEVNSFVSHELNGNDGLIAIQVSGGLPPYSYEWSVGSTLSSIGKLSPGEYSVVIRDSRRCELKKSYKVKPLYNPIKGDLDISLSPTKKEGYYNLRINRVYDKIIYMYIHSPNRQKIKQYFIHPLEKDMKIRVDLSKLKSGKYTAEFVVEDRSKDQPFFIK